MSDPRPEDLEDLEDAPPRRTRRGPPRAVWFALAALLVLLLVIYAARRIIAREAVMGWLQSRGVEAELDFRALDLGGLTGRIRAGPRNDPDLIVDRVEVAYSPRGFWTGDPLGVEIQSVRLVRPVLKARYTQGRLSLGTLDPLLQELRKRPPRPSAVQPRVVVEDGLVRISTEYGLAVVRGDAELNDGKLLRLDARVEPARLRGPEFDISSGPALVRLRTRGDRVDFGLTARVETLTAGAAVAQGARLQISGQAPYPDLKRRRGDGKVALLLTAEGDQLGYAGRVAQDARAEARFAGTTAGWWDTLVLRGDGAAALGAGQVQVGEIAARGAALEAAATGLSWTQPDHTARAESLKIAARTSTAKAGGLSLSGFDARLHGSGAIDAEGPRLKLSGQAQSRGAWTAMGAPRRDDDPEIAAVKRALQGFRLQPASLTLSADADGAGVALNAPARITADSGAVAVISPAASAPLYDHGAGALQLSLAGGGVPEVRVGVEAYRLTASGFAAETELKAKTNLGPLRDGDIAAVGQLRLASGRIEFLGRGCADVSAGRLELGENDVEALKTAVCPADGPMFTFADGAWRLHGEARRLSASAPFLQARASEGSGLVDLVGGDDLRASFRIETARVEDSAPERRFESLRVRGSAALSDELWRGTLIVTDPLDRRLAEAVLHHDDRTGEGGVNLDTRTLVFQEGGLQPAALSPLAAAIGSPATGQAQFTGAFEWSKGGTTSHGLLDVTDLSFMSPAGRVSGLNGQVRFTSLAPLLAPAGQQLSAEAVAAVIPLTGVQASFGLDDGVLNLGGAAAAVGGGQLRLESLSIPLKAGAAWSGVLDVDAVQVKDLVEASAFGDRMDLEAKVTGRVPFRVTPDGVRVSGGELHAIAPGHLSIRREALTAVDAQAKVSAEGAAPTPAPQGEVNPFTDFAYQAMEHLAFSQLSAEINSLPEGRLGILFHIKGEHQPPTHQGQIKLPWTALINRSFLNRTMPLPSGTKVDLTLDTSLNLDQLLRDFARYQQLRSSGAVQPPR